jgi:NAD(P)-dependent dehydrogenase (short-subunit alcohol dehydrogenase family)
MYNPMSLQGKRILVTGASSGIGRCCAEVMSRLGAKIVLVARNTERLQQTLDSLEGKGHLVMPFDLADVEAIPNWLKGIASAGCPLDGLVHSAGIQVTVPLKTMKISEYENLMHINTTTAWVLAKSFRQRGVCQATSSLVFLSSIAGLSGQTGLSAYAASKAALIGLGKTLAQELARDGIRVNCISPGLVETEMVSLMNSRLTQEQLQTVIQAHPLGLGRPEDVAYAAAFLIADTGRWITGTNLVIDGGCTA